MQYPPVTFADEQPVEQKLPSTPTTEHLSDPFSWDVAAQGQITVHL